MEEMIEPDRTIMIVSIIGLVIIWGSVAYRKFAQKGGVPPTRACRVDPPIPTTVRQDPKRNSRRDMGDGRCVNR